VKWLLSGKPAAEFDPNAKKPPKNGRGNNRTGIRRKKNTKPAKTKGVKTETVGQRIGSGIDKIVGF
jgi:hypothetical protein